MMKDKNKKLIIVVGVLLLVIGVSFAYFVSQVLIGGNGAKAKMTTASINGATIEVNGTLTFNDLDIYPGHKTVSGIELIATGDGEFVPYNLVWNGENSLNTPLKFQVYKSESELEVNATCNKTTKIENGAQILAEECSISNIDNLGNTIYEGIINKNSNKVVLSNAEFITATREGTKVYYYVILEYPNLNEEQNIDIGGTFSGKVTVEENNSSADITIASIYKEEDNNYKEVEEIPEGKYVLNEEKSTCTNNAKPTWNSETNTLQVSTLTTSGTECNLYFDILVTGNDTILSDLGTSIKTEVPDFRKVATTDEGVYATSDGMYSGTSYYWRGATTTNHLIFANKCWRIVRINGDNSIRVIYNGSIKSGNTCTGNGENSEAVIMGSSDSDIYYATSDGQLNSSSYVGWTYSLGSQRTTGGTSSNAKIKTESWYSSNIGNNTAYDSKVDNGKFCNDRNVSQSYLSTSGYVTTWSDTGTPFAYATVDRVWDKYEPTLGCPDADIYNLKVGAITADEVELSGGANSRNPSYYLYTGQHYWTMSPYVWSGNAEMFFVHSNGHLFSTSVSYKDTGLRPVINLRSDVIFSGGNGTQSNPYVVAD